MVGGSWRWTACACRGGFSDGCDLDEPATPAARVPGRLAIKQRETSEHKNGLILSVLPISHIDGLRVRGECQWPVTTILFFDTKHSHTAHTQAPTVTLVAPYKRPQPQPLFGIIQRTAAQA